MEEIDLYGIYQKKGQKFNYYFDKITSIFIKSRPRTIENPKKFLFLRNDHVGDMVHSTQAFREIKKAFPDSKIAVLASAGNKAIIEKNKNVDLIIEMDLFWRKRNIKSLLRYLKAVRKIRSEKFDVGIDLRMSKLNVLFFLFIPGIKNRIGYYNVNGGKAFMTHPVLYKEKIHVIKEPVGMINDSFKKEIVKDYFPEIITDEDDEKDVKEFMKINKIKEYIILFPGATTQSKKWPEKKFEELIDIFHKKYPGFKIIISSSNDEKEIVHRLCKIPGITIPLLGYNLRKLAIIIKKAGAVVANNNAGTGIAWPIGGKLIALADGVDLQIHAPLKKTKIIHHKLDCYPCDWTKDCERPCGVWCMDLITVEEVMKAINEFLLKSEN